MSSFPIRYLAAIVGSILVHGSVVHCLAPSSWQSRLDKALLDIDATPESRFRNFQRAIRDPDLRADVTSAIGVIREKGFGKGHPEFINLLWPEGTTARSDLEGLTALRTQLPEALKELPEFVNQSREQQQKTMKSSPSPPDFDSLPQPDEIREEFKNAFRSTPKGLETPKYSVVRVIEGDLKLGVPEKIEIRKYEAFTVATAPSVGGAGFNTLASYLFGGNEEKRSMAMTTPVLTTGNKDGSSSMGTMQFVIPSDMAEAPPTPLSDGDVTIERFPERLVAVKSFPGLVTEDEVSRQKEALLGVLDGTGGVNVLDDDGISVLQYNSPFTIPWRRRNEIAVVVVAVEEEANTADDETVTEKDALEKWKARTSATSWYDAGVRL